MTIPITPQVVVLVFCLLAALGVTAYTLYVATRGLRQTYHAAIAAAPNPTRMRTLLLAVWTGSAVVGVILTYYLAKMVWARL